MSKFAFVSAERANHAVSTLCRIVGVSVSGFYAWLQAIPTTQCRAAAVCVKAAGQSPDHKASVGTEVRCLVSVQDATRSAAVYINASGALGFPVAEKPKWFDLTDWITNGGRPVFRLVRETWNGGSVFLNDLSDVRKSVEPIDAALRKVAPEIPVKVAGLEVD